MILNPSIAAMIRGAFSIRWILTDVERRGKVNGGDGKGKALNHARIRALFVRGDEEGLFFRWLLLGISNDGGHLYVGPKATFLQDFSDTAQFLPAKFLSIDHSAKAP